MELLIMCIVAIVVFVVLWLLVDLIPDAKVKLIAQIILYAGAAVWLLTHVREIIHALAGH